LKFGALVLEVEAVLVMLLALVAEVAQAGAVGRIVINYLKPQI
jgi:hypothetical protein